MEDELDILKVVATRLEAAQIRYMVTGSMATSFYARPRMTRDIDIVLEVGADGADRIVDLFADDFLCEGEAVSAAVRTRGMFNIIHYDSVVKVDFIVRKDTPYRAEEMRRRRTIDLGDTLVWVVAPEDLVLSKLYWAKDTHSDLQLGDVRNLLASVDDLDSGALGRVSVDLGTVGGGALVNDTSTRIQDLQHDLLLRRSGPERLRMASSMFATARRLIRASLGDPMGSDDSVEMRVQLFLRTYGQDFAETTRDRIATELRARLEERHPGRTRREGDPVGGDGHRLPPYSR